MSDQKERTIKDVHEEYSRLCAQAGHMQYNIRTIQKDLEILNDRLRDLNLEAATFSAKEAEAKKAEGSNG